MEYREKYEGWLSNPYFDENTKDELRSIAEDDNEIKERFYKDLEFGTAGLRGIIGAGTNRMKLHCAVPLTESRRTCLNPCARRRNFLMLFAPLDA